MKIRCCQCKKVLTNKLPSNSEFTGLGYCRACTPSNSLLRREKFEAEVRVKDAEGQAKKAKAEAEDQVKAAEEQVDKAKADARRAKSDAKKAKTELKAAVELLKLAETHLEGCQELTSSQCTQTEQNRAETLRLISMFLNSHK